MEEDTLVIPIGNGKIVITGSNVHHSSGQDLVVGISGYKRTVRDITPATILENPTISRHCELGQGDIPAKDYHSLLPDWEALSGGATLEYTLTEVNAWEANIASAFPHIGGIIENMGPDIYGLSGERGKIVSIDTSIAGRKRKWPASPEVYFYPCTLQQPYALVVSYTEVKINWGTLLAGARYSYPPSLYTLQGIDAPQFLNADIRQGYYGGSSSGNKIYSGVTNREAIIPDSITLNFILTSLLEFPEDIVAIGVDNTTEAGGTPDDPDDPTKVDKGDTTPGEGGGKSSGKGSVSGGGYNGAGGASGLNSTATHYGDSVIKYDSIYMSIGEYNSFVTAGGGIVCESGIFPFSNTFFIASINLSISGSIMQVTQVCKFDATPVMEVGEKIYGYIIKASGEKQPTFAGYITSMSKKIDDNTQEITFECRDLKMHLDQFITPIVYKTKNTPYIIATDLLEKAGIFNVVNNLPTTFQIPLDYTAESMISVLDNLCNISGSYHYWINKNGFLNISNISDGSVIKSFRIPTEGEAVGTNKVMSFNVIVDNSLSRSKIVVLGDVPLVIHSTNVMTPTTKIWGLVSSRNIVDQCNITTEGYASMKIGWNGIPDYMSYGSIHNSLYFKQVIRGEVLNTLGNTNQPPYAQGPEWIYTSVGIDYQQEKPKIPAVYINGDTIIFGPFWAWSGFAGVGCIGPYVDIQIGLFYDYKEGTAGQLLPIKYVYDTGNTGGVYVYRNSAFKKVSTPDTSIDDTFYLRVVAKLLADYYKPVYSGRIILDGLDTDLYLGGKLSVTNTSLPSAESSNLIIYGITYNFDNLTTEVELSTSVYGGLPYIDPEVVKQVRSLGVQVINNDTNRLVRNKIIDIPSF